MTDWTTARVVRADGELWGRTLNRWELLDPHARQLLTADQLAPYDPQPVLDADGLPVVRTVGDLTMRHVGRHVRLDEHYDAKLETIFAHDGGEVSLNFTHPEGFAFGCSRPLDTPCEVLDD